MTRTVIYIVDSLGLSGKTGALTNLALGLDRSQFRGIVVTFASPEGILAERLKQGGVPVIHVPCEDGLQARAIGGLVQLFRKHPPAVVHCFNPRPMLYGGIAAAAIARPAIGTLSAFACMSGPYEFLPQPLHTKSVRNRIRNYVVGRLMRRVAAVSSRAGEAFCTTNAIPRKKLRVIRYGVDLEKVDYVAPDDVARMRAEIGVAPGELLVGSVGRLVEQKDYPTQLRGFALAARKLPLRMLVAGGGPLAPQLRELAQQLGIADRVCWLGERTDVPAVLRCLDMFVIASQFEPFGVSVLEAMAAGLPIISTNVNELPEILDGGRAGMLVPPKRPEALAEALEQLSADPALRARLSRHARSLAQSRYSLDAAVTEYTNLYDEVVEEGAR